MDAYASVFSNMFDSSDDTQEDLLVALEAVDNRPVGSVDDDQGMEVFVEWRHPVSGYNL